MENNIAFSVVFLSGGIGARMGTEIPKQYITILDKPIALYSFEVFLNQKEVKEIVVVCDQEYQYLFTNYQSDKITFASPGLRRQDSLYNGIQALQNTDDHTLICIHDAARPIIDSELVRRVVRLADQWEAAVAGVPVTSTIKMCDGSQLVINTLDRSHIWEIQTPQVIRLSLLKKGLEQARELNLTVTDDVSLVEFLGKPVKVVDSAYSNIKVTTPEDLLLVNQLLEKHAPLLQTDNSL